jgi:hypothetical protein
MSARVKASARCVICGRKDIERNHVGGRNHVAWFTMQFCVAHHAQFHHLVRAAGVDLEYTSDPQERLLRAQKACMIAQWMLTEALQNLNSQKVTSERLLAGRNRKNRAARQEGEGIARTAGS